ncbi:MAG: nicotinate (nicotinamide) nucleotide adenylyltransferase [Lentisphaeria bacterium]|nr:nicotinate (nicotinamide) nucleotide adenylyltransferase [Lentisphaeria bacterium]
MSTVFFGGSFDPPHAGHLGVAQGALLSGRCNRIMWAPAFLPPHKLNGRRESFFHRYNMTRLLTAGLERHIVSDLEYRRRREPSYTFDILEDLNSTGEEKFQLLIGADSLLELHRWHRAQELAARFEVLTYPRPGYDVTLEVLKEHFPLESAEKLFAGCLDGKFFEISSTNLRFSMEKSANWDNIISMTPVPVAEYCRRHGLYHNLRSSK